MYRLRRQQSGVTVTIDILKKGVVPGTWETHARMWRRFVKHATRPSLDADVLIDFVQRLTSSESITRPQTTVDKFKSLISLVCSIDEQPNPFGHVLVSKVVDALVKVGTTRGRERGPILDSYKVLRFLRARCSANMVSRQLALAALAVSLPNRPRELATLRRENIRVEFPTHAVGKANEMFPLELLPRSKWPHIGRPHDEFIVHFRLVESKTDHKAKNGIDKLLQHPHGAEWSPALMLLRYWTGTKGAMAFPRADGGNDKPLAVDTISKELSVVAADATGVRVTGKWWRHAAATWLLRNGVDVETVAALGGWADSKALRRFYVRATRWDAETARRVAGLDEPGFGRRPFAALPPVVRAEPASPLAGGGGGGGGGDDDDDDGFASFMASSGSSTVRTAVRTPAIDAVRRALAATPPSALRDVDSVLDSPSTPTRSTLPRPPAPRTPMRSPPSRAVDAPPGSTRGVSGAAVRAMASERVHASGAALRAATSDDFVPPARDAPRAARGFHPPTPPSPIMTCLESGVQPLRPSPALKDKRPRRQRRAH